MLYLDFIHFLMGTFYFPIFPTTSRRQPGAPGRDLPQPVPQDLRVRAPPLQGEFDG